MVRKGGCAFFFGHHHTPTHSTPVPVVPWAHTQPSLHGSYNADESAQKGGRPLLVGRMLALSFGAALSLVQPKLPTYPPELQRSIQPWGVSTLREQIKAHHVQRVAIHEDETAVEVLDYNGLQRRVHIFPDMTPMLVEDLHEAHIPFYIAPAPWQPPIFLVAFLRALTLTLLVIASIAALGMMEEFILGCIIVGNGLQVAMAELLAIIESSVVAMETAFARDDESAQAIPVPIDDDDDDGPFDAGVQ
jgi:hypothetical protein